MRNEQQSNKRMGLMRGTELLTSRPFRQILTFLFFVIIPTLVQPVAAQILEPVKCNPSLVTVNDTLVELRFKATIDAGWHLYSTRLGDGPISASLKMETLEGARLLGELSFTDGTEKKQEDPMFGMEVRFFEGKVTFVQKVRPESSTYRLAGYFEYGACNEVNCLPPTKVEFDYNGTSKVVGIATAAGKGAADSSSDNSAEEATATAPESANSFSTAHTNNAVLSVATDGILPDALLSQWWSPVIAELQQEGMDALEPNQPWWSIFLTGFVGGLLALLTPCVWPIIPMTVSFFLKRAKDKRKGRRDAYLYGASIVVIYLVLGLAITLLFGASALNALSTAAIPNLFFFLLLVVFGLSFLGAFEITLPSSWTTSVDGKAEKTGGIWGVFLMAFTLTLVSFSCTGPIIGFLLVEVSTMGNLLGPAIGMLGFALALALPFTLFAIFPAWLKTAPKSGNWMNTVKVVLAFIELAFALKFFSVADLAYGWHLLDRETFLVLWIALAALLGCYLLGWIRFPHDEDEGHPRVSVTRFMLALVSFAFAIYMVPGLWGAPLKAVSAFAPPMSTQDFNLYDKEAKPQFMDYDEGMQYARRVGKPVMIDFSGYGCVNCRKMEQSVLADEQVSAVINKEYVLISLFVDDKTPLSQRLQVMENGKMVTLRTVGDRWSYLQRTKFGASAQPFYVLLDNEGKPLNGSRSFDEDVEAFLRFLQQGLTNYVRR